MMQTPVRYYITKDHDQPVVRTVPVAVARLPRPNTIESASAVAAKSTPSATQQAPEHRRMMRLVRAAVRRTTLDAAD